MFKKKFSSGAECDFRKPHCGGFVHVCYLLPYRSLHSHLRLGPIPCALFSFLLVSTNGCRNLPPLPAANLSEQGWTVRQGQAVWRRAKGSPEIAGELLVGTRTNGEAFVQFTKTPFPVVIAQKTSDEWQIQAPAQNETHVGPGKPPERIIWFGLAQALAGDALPRQWSWRYDSNSWSLENRTSGESLSGYFLEKSAARAGASR